MGLAGDRLLNYWATQVRQLAPPVPEALLQEFEASNRVALPVDFREYFLHVDGMLQEGSDATDKRGFCFWSLSQIRGLAVVAVEHSLGLHEDPERFFVFADYLQWSWGYAICLLADPTRSGRIIHVGTLQPKTVASNFSEFVDCYVRDCSRLYPE